MTVVGAVPAEIHSGLAAIGRRLIWERLDQAGAAGREVLDADREAPARGGRWGPPAGFAAMGPLS